MAGIALTAMFLAAAPAPAGKQQWGFVKSGSEALLVYGVPESDSITVSFICQPKRRTIDVVSTVLPGSATPGRAGTVKLSSGTASLIYSGKVGGDNHDRGLHFAAVTPIDGRLFDLLETGSSIRIEAFGAHDSVPLDRVKKPLAEMRKACR